MPMPRRERVCIFIWRRRSVGRCWEISYGDRIERTSQPADQRSDLPGFPQPSTRCSRTPVSRFPRPHPARGTRVFSILLLDFHFRFRTVAQQTPICRADTRPDGNTSEPNRPTRHTDGRLVVNVVVVEQTSMHKVRACVPSSWQQTRSPAAAPRPSRLVVLTPPKSSASSSY